MQRPDPTFQSPRELFDTAAEMGKVMLAVDWADTTIGAVDSWSPSLRMMVRFLLANRFPILLWWGPKYCQLYNDAYRPILGAKHPHSMGQAAAECWREIWHIIGPLVDTPFSGGPSTWMEDIPLEINRHGFVEETHFTIAYSPIPDETVPSGIGGVLATVHEISEKVVGARRVMLLRDLGARSADAKTPEEACLNATKTLSNYEQDIPFALIYLISEDRKEARLAATAAVEMGHAIAPVTIDLPIRETSGWPIGDAVRGDAIHIVEDLPSLFSSVPQGPWSDAPKVAAVVPIKSNIARQPVGLLIAGISARLKLDDGYRVFLDLLSTQVATAIANARAYAEERKRAEALAEIDRAKTAFFSNVSHEFRTPLTLMLGPLQDAISQSHDLVPQRVAAELAMVHRNSLRLLKLVNTLLEFARIEAGRAEAVYEPTDISTYTADLASVFRSAVERAGLRLIVDCPPLSEPVYLDREMWEKIVLNLLSNAFKFTFEGEIGVFLRSRGNDVELEIRDTGTGIAEGDLPQLFQRFHRIRGVRSRTHEGSGIGLALVQELARLHGGTVRVSSIPGTGSSFTVTIPAGASHLASDRIGVRRTLQVTSVGSNAYVEEALRWLPDSELSQPEPFDVEMQRPSASAIDKRPHILLADDNADMRAYLTRLLAAHYEIDAVGDGNLAIRAIKRRLPDLVLADVMMPGLDGLELVRALRQNRTTSNIPVILLSARAGEEAKIGGFEAGANDYLVKPFSARELLARIASQLELDALRRRVEAQFQRLVKASTAVNAALSVDEAVHIVVEEVRQTIGAHQSIATVTIDMDLAQALSAVSFSDKYAEYRTHDGKLDGEGVYSVVRRLNRPIRMNQTELEADPDFRAVAKEARNHPPLRGLLAAPMVSREGKNIGFILVSDKYAGEFTDTDEAILSQLAQMAAVAIENAQFYKAAQDARFEAEKANRDKDQFLANVSHEIRTPLSAIFGWSRILRSRSPGPEQFKKGLEVIERNCEVQLRLIDDLIDVARIISGKLKLATGIVDPVDVVLAAIETVRLGAEAKGVRIESSLDANAGTIPGDSARLQQVVWNLLSNAVKFTPEGGRVEVRVDRTDSQVKISISDSGLGIKPDFLPFMFNRFVQAESSRAPSVGGLGLGLAIVKSLVELHGGTVQAASPGERLGSTFTVTLPAAVERRETAQSTRNDQGILAGLSILVVDDEADARALVVAVLQKHAAELREASSVPEALQMLEAFTPDVLICDIGIPHQDGYELIRQVRKSAAVSIGPPAIALTVFARPADRRRALLAGFQSHVGKPFKASELVAAVANLAGRNVSPAL